MGKYAVVIGANYTKNPEAALMGCCNDARLIVNMLHNKGFEDDEIKMLVDDDDDYESPNHVNIKNALDWLCTDRQPGDYVFMHFSGHGTQVPSDGDDHEADNLDEAIVLEELFLMADDDLKQYFSRLPVGVIATVITDCCHSGTMLDGTEVVIEGPKDDDEAGEQLPESDSLLETLGGSRAVEVSSTRSLPIETICNVMSQKLGTEVQPTGSGVNGAMAQVFGGSAGKLMLKFAMSQLNKDGQGDESSRGLFSMFTSHFGKKPQAAAAPPPSDPISSALGGVMSSFGMGGLGGGSSAPPAAAPPAATPPTGGDPMGMLGGMLGGMGLAGMGDNATAAAPPYNPDHESMSEDVCVLITGCQSDETSADVRPPGGDAFGALTKTLTDIVAANENISYYDLVQKVRRTLSDGGFQQNPCLETTEDRASTVFICES